MVGTWRISLGLLACSLAVEAAGKTPYADVLRRTDNPVRSNTTDRIVRPTSVRNISPEKKTIESLRALGPAGLAEALAKYDQLRADYARLEADAERLHADVSEIKKETLAGIERQMAELGGRIKRVAAAIDEIGGARSCTVSRLYWYTDLEEAKWAAEKTGRPILSLRMLGKLTDEYSCANSRFFRTALYSNKEIGNYLRDHFVLHWQSVRPVPRVTVDFGDGRKLQRTLTGNSAHHALTSTEKPLDVLPGLYGPKRFLIWLGTMRALHANYVAADESQRDAVVVQHHMNRRDALLEQWDVDIQRLGDAKMTLVSSRIDSAIEAARATGEDVPDAKPAPDARLAARRAVSKSAAEVPMLRFANMGGQWMERGMDDDLWDAIANLHREESALDEASVAVVQGEFPNAALAGEISVSKRRQEDPVLRMVRAFETSMALDTVRNEYLLHRRIHEQFSESAPTTVDVDTLNEWVYAELFLTPSSDPWLGLAPRDVYTALEGDGRIEPAATLARGGGG